MTKLNLIVFLPAVLLLGVFSFEAQSQVTIGAGSQPAPGALLQLKEKDVSNGGANSTKGLELSRVALTDKSKLYPMFQPGSSGNYSIGSLVYSKAPEDAKHTGLIVYHTGNATMPEGVYYWDGREWIQAKGAGNVWYVENSTVAATTNSQPIYHQGNVAIGTASSNANLTVNGKLTITDTPLLANSSLLVLDNHGNVGTAVTIPAQMMFVQSKNTQEYRANSNNAMYFNQAVRFPVTWMQNDIQSNNIMAFDEKVDNTVFTFQRDGVYELSGYLNYKPGAAAPQTLSEVVAYTSRIGLNVAIQSYDEKQKVWNNIAAARHMTSGVLVSVSAVTVVVPPVLATFAKGDKIRMVFYRPNDTFGLPHGVDEDFGITTPTGIEFTKGMKVMAY